MKLKKLDDRAFSHVVLGAVFVVVFAIAGVAYLVSSHADSAAKKVATGTVLVRAVTCTKKVADYTACTGKGARIVTSKADLYVSQVNPGTNLECNGVAIPSAYTQPVGYDFHQTRRLVCSNTGLYDMALYPSGQPFQIGLAKPAPSTYAYGEANGSWVFNPANFLGKTLSVTLGSTQ